MKKSSKVSSHQPIPFLLIDFLMFPLLGLSIGIIDFCMIKRTVIPSISDSTMLGLGIATVLFTLAGFILYLFVEHKYNRLKLKNVFLYLGVIIAITNLIAVATLPSELSLPYDVTLTITVTARIYYITSGFFYAMLPYLCFYLIPRKITSRHYLDIVLYVILGFTLLTILLSFITDWNKYLNLFNSPDGIGSIFFGKNPFAHILFNGMFISVILRIRHRNWRWSLLLIPFYVFLLLTLSKITILIATLFLLIYLIVELVRVCKKSKDNLVITLLIVGIFVLLSPLFIIGVINSQTGILASIRTLFVDLFDNARTTIETRLVIWQSAFKLLSSYRVIFGYGINSFGLALHLVYTKAMPVLDPNVYAAHNFVVELLGNGGIILLGVYLFIYVYFVYALVKMRNRNTHWWIDATIVFLALFTLLGMFESVYLCNIYAEAIMSITLVGLVMSEYYISKDKDEIAVRKDIVNSANKVKKVNFKNKLLRLNKKRLIREAKYIAYDLNAKAHLSR